jgi:hypothetical protein
MKKTKRPQTKKLKLARETVHQLTSHQLVQAASGCDMTTWTTLQIDGASATC